MCLIKVYMCKILQNQLITAHTLSHIKVLMHLALAVCFLRKCLYNVWKSSVSLEICEPPREKTNKMAVCPAKTQISLGIRPVWSESSLSAWRKFGSLATRWEHSEDSDQSGRMPRLIRVLAWRTDILLVLSWGGSCCDLYYLNRGLFVQIVFRILEWFYVHQRLYNIPYLVKIVFNSPLNGWSFDLSQIENCFNVPMIR